MQRDQSHVRVNAQLIDGETGAHLWADRFEEDVAGLFKLQEQVVARLANTLGYELVKAEAEKSAHSKNSDAIDLAMRGRALVLRSLQQPTRNNIKAVRALYEQSLEIDPNNPTALVGAASIYWIEDIYGWGSSETDYDAKILGQTDRAMALAPDFAAAYFVKSGYLGNSHRFTEAVGAADAGLALNPNYASLYSARGHAETVLGRFEQAKSDLQQAMRLSPRDPARGLWQVELGDVELGAGRIRGSIVEYQKAIDGGHRVYWVYANLAAAYALEGRMDEAKSALAEARRLNSSLTVKWYAEHTMDLPNRSEGLRKAGLPEE
ncbi:MAG: hypothetical protein ACLPX7_04105 [Xanthobacteraceae bacterium]